MASGLYSSTIKNSLNNTLANNFASDTFYCMLVTSSYTPQLDTHVFKSDVGNEVTAGSGYLAGGKALANPTLTATTNGDSIVTWNADDISWTSSTISGAAAAVIYNQSIAGADTARPLIAYIDFGGAFSTTSGTFEIQWNPAGIFTLDLKP